MRRKIWTAEKINSFLKEIGHTEICIDKTSFKDAKTKCRFIDSDYGEWWALPENIIYRKSRHPKRGHGNGGLKLRNSIEEVKLKIKENYGDLIKIDESTYSAGKKKAKFIDKDYGEFWCVADAIINGSRKGHPMRGRSFIGESKKISFEEAAEKIKKVWGFQVQIIEDSYRGFSQKCKFIDKDYGIWEANPRSVEKGHGHPLAGIEKQKRTMIERYGKEKPSQIREFALKSSFSSTRKVTVIHWKTNEKIPCTASYEYAVINKLNEMRVDYKFQIPFDVKIGDENKIYFIDLYLPEQDLYIEIKGYFREMGRKKWEEFHKKYPNSELWRLDEVKNFTKKTEYRLTKDFKLAVLKQAQLLSQVRL